MKTDKAEHLLLAGDVGATKTHLGIYNSLQGPLMPIYEEILPSARYGSLTGMVGDFISRGKLKPGRAVFGVAGPVTAGRCQLTNLTWEIDESSLAAELEVESVKLVNDLLAMAWSIRCLGPDDFCVIQEGNPGSGGNMAIIAPGTGLGEAFLTWNGQDYEHHPSEGGHADFAPNSPLEAELYLALSRELGHVSWNRVCSGLGIPRIYRFLLKRNYSQANATIREIIASALDQTPIIIASALENTCPICRATMEIFVSVLGAEAGNLALKFLASGGVYLGGGLPPRILPLLKSDSFLKSFCNKGRLSGIPQQTPVKVIVRPGVGLIGAAALGLTGGRKPSRPQV